jgi:hypothetical protein
MDTILTAYFQIFPQEYFLLFIAFGISAVIVYTLFTFFDN